MTDARGLTTRLARRAAAALGLATLATLALVPPVMADSPDYDANLTFVCGRVDVNLINNTAQVADFALDWDNHEDTVEAVPGLTTRSLRLPVRARQAVEIRVGEQLLDLTDRVAEGTCTSEPKAQITSDPCAGTALVTLDARLAQMTMSFLVAVGPAEPTPVDVPAGTQISMTVDANPGDTVRVGWAGSAVLPVTEHTVGTCGTEPDPEVAVEPEVAVDPEVAVEPEVAVDPEVAVEPEVAVLGVKYAAPASAPVRAAAAASSAAPAGTAVLGTKVAAARLAATGSSPSITLVVAAALLVAAGAGLVRAGRPRLPDPRQH